MAPLIPRHVLVLAIALLLLPTIALAKQKNHPSPYAKLDIFARVLALVEQHHVETPDEAELMIGAIKGLLRSLDPHSSYLPARQFKMLQEDTEGNFAGVGMEVAIRDGKLTVITPIPDSPAMDAGVRTDDVILTIMGRDTAQMDMEEAVGLMRGKEGTDVTITIFRKGKDLPFEVTLTRAVIEIQSVRSALLEPGYLHLELRSFTDGVAARIRTHLKRAQSEGGQLQGILLDMRGNPGGLMYEAVKVCDLFLSDGTIVSTKGRGGKVLETFNAHRPGTYRDLPIVILIDGGSASASEIVAGALQDSHRALLVGTRSFGKGSVQTIIPMRDGSGLKLTTALYYTPGGRSIQDTGIEPDEVVKPGDDDPQLRKALQLLKKRAPGAATPAKQK